MQPRKDFGAVHQAKSSWPFSLEFFNLSPAEVAYFRGQPVAEASQPSAEVLADVAPMTSGSLPAVRN